MDALGLLSEQATDTNFDNDDDTLFVQYGGLQFNEGLQVDIRVLDAESFGAALHYFTGSKDHNIQIRDRAKDMGLKVSEYGVFDDSVQAV